MELHWTSRAMNERDLIYDYIAQDSPAAAQKIDDLLERRAESLCDHPLMGRLGRMPDTRELPVHRHYLLIYDIKGEHIRILRVLHTARRWPPPTEET